MIYEEEINYSMKPIENPNGRNENDLKIGSPIDTRAQVTPCITEGNEKSNHFQSKRQSMSRASKLEQS